MSVTGTNIVITTRTEKGSALTHAELDANQTGLKSAIEDHSHDDFATASHTHTGFAATYHNHAIADTTGLQTALNDKAAAIHTHTGFAAALGTDDNYVTGAEKSALHSHTNKTALDKISESAGSPTWNGGAWPSSAGGGGDMHKSVYDPDGDGHINYNDLQNKPTIPSVTGLLDETAHDALDHSGLTGIPAAYTLPTASTTVLGGIKVDGTTITISNGVASAASGSGGMTNPMTAAGSIIIGGTDGAPVELEKGANGQVLTLTSGLPTWAPAAGGGASAQQTTVTLTQNASANITATAIVAVYESALAPAYSNSGGSGNRTGQITVTVSGNYQRTGTPGSWVDGVAGNWGLNTVPAEGCTAEFVFATLKKITEARVICTGSHGTWKMQARANAGGTWIDLCSPVQLAADAVFDCASNNEAYTHYRIIGVSGTVDGSYYMDEIEFKITDVGANQLNMGTDYSVMRIDDTNIVTRLKPSTASMIIYYL